MKIRAIVGRKLWSTWRVMNYISHCSKHEIELGAPPQPDEDIDLVYWRWGMRALNHGRQIRKLHEAGVKLVLGISGFGTLSRTRHPNMNRWAEWVHRNFSAITANNLELKKISEETRPTLPVYHCPSGVDTSTFKPAPFPDEFHIGWVGNVDNPWKNVSDFRLLPFPQRMVGPGTEAGRWKYEKMPEFYSQISVYVSTSKKEGSPLPPKEAAASGRPVVATAVGDLVEWIPPQYLVDDPRELKPLIEAFQIDPDLLASEGRRFRQISLLLDYRHVVKKFDQMFDEVSQLA